MHIDLGDLIAHSGWFITLGTIFLGGLALNLTPCVYPMIPITISYFGGTSGEGTSRRAGLTRAVLFVIGIAITYSVLGVVASLTGRIFGATSGSIYAVSFVSAVMFLMGLSMFGVFQMAAPSSWMSGIQDTRDRLGWLGALFFGLVIGIVMAPCVGPFITALIAYVAGKGDPLLGFWLFFTLAMGMGAPYIVLGFFTTALKSLPRPGFWMVWLERFFGFILIGYAYSLWMPFIPSDAVAHGILAVYLLVAAIVLAYMNRTANDLKTVLIVGFFAAAFLVAQQSLTSAGIIGTPAAPVVAASGTAAPLPTRVEWKPYSESALAAALAEHKPVMIDFFAKWCGACKELDDKTYSDPTVIAAAANFVCFKADFTEVQDIDSDATAKRFKIKGLPTVVFFSAQGKELNNLRLEDFTPPAKMVDLLQKAAQDSPPSDRR